MSPELENAAHGATAADTAKAAAWRKFTQAIEAWWAGEATPEAHRALADAACEYAGKRVERHVAAEREAIAAALDAEALTRWRDGAEFRERDLLLTWGRRIRARDTKPVAWADEGTRAMSADEAARHEQARHMALEEAAQMADASGRTFPESRIVAGAIRQLKTDVGAEHHRSTKPPAFTGQQPVAPLRSNEDLDRNALVRSLRAECDQARAELAQEKAEYDNVARQLDAAETKWRREMRAADVLRAEREAARRERDQYRDELEGIRQSASVAVEQRTRLLDERSELYVVLRSIAAECGGHCLECHGPEWAKVAIEKFDAKQSAALAKVGGGA